jgi:hypothetical protein
MPPNDGFLLLDSAKFSDSFAADVEPGLATFMGASQVPWGLEALNGAVSNASWKNKPTWYLVATDDKMIPPDAQRFMAKRAGATVAEAKGSHAIYVSKPQAVADLIAQAAMEQCRRHLCVQRSAGVVSNDMVSRRVDGFCVLVDRSNLPCPGEVYRQGHQFALR